MPNLRRAFIETKEHFKISGVALSRQSGISEKHISQFTCYKKGSTTEYKSDLTTTSFGQLLSGLASIEPQALNYFFDVFYGSDLKLKHVEPVALVNAMTKNQMSEFMFAIAAKIGEKSNSSDELYTEDEQMLIHY